MNKRLGFFAGALVLVVLIVILATLFTPSVSEQQSFNKTIEVSGSGEVKVTPDEVHIMVAVVSEALTAQQAAAMNAENMTEVFAALRRAGIGEIKTRQYSITPIYEWMEEITLEGKRQKSVIVGYRATNLIEVICKPEEAGKAIDAAVMGGANQIDSIAFQLSESLSRTAYNDALRKAVRNAQSKADLVAGEMGIVGIYPVRIAVEDFYVPVYRVALPMEAAATPAPTPITPSEVEVSARVSIVYAFN